MQLAITRKRDVQSAEVPATQWGMSNSHGIRHGFPEEPSGRVSGKQSDGKIKEIPGRGKGGWAGPEGHVGVVKCKGSQDLENQLTLCLRAKHAS